VVSAGLSAVATHPDHRLVVFLVVASDNDGMDQPSDLISTGKAAVLLGCSRQHVVDLCERGLLRFVSVGSHRRVRRTDVTALVRPVLTRDQERSLWLHRVAAGRLAIDPDSVLTRVRTNLEHLSRVHPSGMSAVWLAEWQAVLAEGEDAVFTVLTSTEPRAIELRQNSPFAGVLSPEERAAALAAFRDHWHRVHAA
jgi:excisionase family DNA binding protein